MIELICKNCGKKFLSERRSKKYCSCACANTYSSRQRAKAFEDKPSATVWCSGGGVQSTAIAALIYRGKIPKPDYAFMADCGYESARTYSYLQRIIVPKMREIGVNFEIVKSSNYVNVELIDSKGYCNLPAFQKNADGSVSHFSTRCNGTWKQQVMRAWLRERGVEKCVNWLGISTDEAHRARYSRQEKWIVNKYPLIELRMDRKACANFIKETGWEMPIRTSCIMCPQRTKFEWLKLKIDCPGDFDRACAIEKEIQAINPNVFLSAECRPLAEIVENE